MKRRHGTLAKKRTSPHVLIYGIHAVRAALANPRRNVIQAFATVNAANRMASEFSLRALTPQIVTPKDLDARLGPQAIHQGVLVEADPLEPLDLADIPRLDRVLVLDQVTDPHNVGAVLRTAAAFNADALIMTVRHSPPLEGALAKAASGGLEHVPVVLVPNLAQALSEIGERGALRIGLDSDAGAALEDEPGHPQTALVLGAEDRGLRRLTRERCDKIRALRTPGPIKSLNVSNAAAIALHLIWQKQRNASG